MFVVCISRLNGSLNKVRISYNAILIYPFFNFGHSEAVNGTLASYLIPKRPIYGCPANSYGCTRNDCNHLDTCFCEEHCSWETCRLFDHPDVCLTDIKSRWVWDLKQKFWVAQAAAGMINIKTNDTMNTPIKWKCSFWDCWFIVFLRLEFSNWIIEENVYCKNYKQEEHSVSLLKCQSLCLNLNYCVGVSFVTNLGGGVATTCIFCSDEIMLENKKYDFYRRPGNVQCKCQNQTQLYYSVFPIWRMRLRNYILW